MENTLGKKITFFSLIKDTFPSIIMMVFFSMYTIVDGIFISVYVGPNGLSAANIVYPVINIIMGVGIMMATGGSAIIARFMGEKKEIQAKEGFSFIISVVAFIGILLGIGCIIFINPIVKFLGATDILYGYCYTYLFINLIFSPAIILKMFFDYFLITAGAPKLGLISSVLGGITNMILDYVFIAVLNMGIKGAALATGIGYVLPCIIGLVYFCNKNNVLHFVKPKINFNIIKNSMINGSSEMVTQISSAVTTYMYNIVMLKFLGESGVAAITIILYVQFFLVAAYIGFTSGTAPKISYNYGKQDHDELKKIIKYSFIFISMISVVSFLLSIKFSSLLVSVFTGKGSELYYLTLHGFQIFGVSFLLSGINIFSSGMFTAFSNGKISALLSSLRTLIFFLIGIMVLPVLFDIDGVWMVVPFAECITIIVSIICIYRYKKVYKY